MPRSHPGSVVAALLSLAVAVPAQAPPLPPAAATATMHATERFLFVVRGSVLYQFDVQSLKLLNQFTFPAAQDVAVAAPPAEGVSETTATEFATGPAHDAEAFGASVKSAVDWLAAHQDDDGHWDADGFMKHDTTGEACDGPGNPVHDVGVTGLALLAMLGEGSTMRDGPRRDNVRRAVTWLKQHQGENGLFGVNAAHDFIYDHAIAAYAMCETYGLSKYALLEPIAQRGLDYLESHRNPYAVWRYQPRDNDNDTSVTTWAVAANESGRSFGLDVNKNARQLAIVWYDQVTAPNGSAGYTKMGEPSSRKPGEHSRRFPVERGEAMTAAAMYGRLMLGQSPDDVQGLKAGASRLLAKLPAWEKDSIDPVYWFFGTFAMYQIGGREWDAWRNAIEMLVDHQCRDGNRTGSWDPVGVWDEDGGRVFVTALNALSLEVLHRQARMVR